MCKLLVAALLSTAAATSLRKTAGNVNDKISINGETVMEGANIQVGCHTAPSKATSVTVCGASYKVVANLLTECKAYKGYSETIGHCDSGNSACDTKSLESGYTEKFNWQAVSYEVQSC
eukprot:TRINITY_DN1118_c0_g1_i1.p2 TRINITY_DN1118_c0_g1~~TRINITY_DN1118_c0_g1_i1.p2  ORF type:complete len:119 (-),score=42.25 TRINITY_DN1118_c0_g1_i1:71-427(-)